MTIQTRVWKGQKSIMKLNLGNNEANKLCLAIDCKQSYEPQNKKKSTANRPGFTTVETIIAEILTKTLETLVYSIL